MDQHRPPLAPLFVTILEAGNMLGCKRSTIYRLMASGDVRGVKLGTRRLVTVESVHALAARLIGKAA